MKIDLKDALGAKVISIAVARKTYDERTRAPCSHIAIEVDPLLSRVTCQKCGASVNPVEWIAMLAEHWECIERINEKLHAQHLLLQHEAKLLEQQQRAKCQHCQRITRVRLPRISLKDQLSIVQTET